MNLLKVSFKIILLGCMVCFTCSNVGGQIKSQGETNVEPKKPKPSNEKAYAIGKTIEIKSEILSETRSIIVSLPRGYATGQQRYPVLYVLDGRNNFLHTTATARFLAGNRRIPDLIVVAVKNTRRTRDLTPKSEFEKDIERFPTHGGADNFNKFLQKELVPFINQKYRTTKYRSLIGHSFGGLFIFHLLQNDPDAFDSYLAISPSLWWNDQGLVKSMTDKLESFPKQSCRVFMTLGNEKGKMIESIEKMQKILKDNAPENLKWKFQLLDDETHGSVPLRSTYRGLPFLLKDVKVETGQDAKNR